MTVKLNTSGESHATSLIASGKVDDGEWSFSAEDGNKLLGANGDDWTNYAKWHLGEDESASEKTKERYKYPYGKDGKVFRRGVAAAESRAATAGADSVAEGARRLMAKMQKSDDDGDNDGDKKSMQSRSWFSIRSQDMDGNPVDPEVMLYDEIGSWGVSAADFASQLKALGDVKKITMRVNSPGGDSFAGIAMYNTLKAHPAEKTCYIDGMAASAASLVCMAADKIIAPENSFMVVHEPSAMTVGPAQAHLDMAADLERVSAAYANTYAQETGQTLENVRSLMAEDRLMSARECMEKGYVDEVTKPVMMTATFALDKVPEKYRAMIASVYRPDSADEARRADKERARVECIRGVGTKSGMPTDVIEAAIKDGMSKKDFRKAALDHLLAQSQTIEALKAGTITMSEAITTTAATTTAAATEYGAAEMSETLEICTLAGLPISAANKFIADKTPVSKVREAILASRASKSDALDVTSHVTEMAGANGEAISSEARMTSWHETQVRVRQELGIGK